MEIKAGFKTSEFWLAIMSFVFGGGLLTGYIDVPATDYNQIAEWIVQVVGGISAVLSIVTYVVARLSLKKAAVKSTQIQPVAGGAEQPTSGVDDLLPKPAPAQYPK